MMRIGAGFAILPTLAFIFVACSGEVEVTREVPTTVEVTREVPATVEVTREVPATVEVTREVPVTVEVARVTPDTPPGQQSGVAQSSRLELVRDRGRLFCASRNDVPGFGHMDAYGNNAGFDIDLCRAVATAVLGDPDAIEIRLIAAAERGPTIQSGEVDLLVRTVTWTNSRDAEWGNYVQTMLYDGQGFLVRKDLGLKSALELKGARVCVVQGTTLELNLHRFSERYGLNIELLAFEDTEATLLAYRDGECDALTNDRSQLAALSTVLDNSASHTIFPETISEEPMGPVVPHGDDQWFDIVKTVMAILIHGEAFPAYGITSRTVPSTATNFSGVDRLLGIRHHLSHRPFDSYKFLWRGQITWHPRLFWTRKPGFELHRSARRLEGRRKLWRDTSATWAQAPSTCPERAPATPCGRRLPAGIVPRAVKFTPHH